MRQLFILVITLLLASFAVAQNNLYGTITDKAGEPLPGATLDLNDGE